MKSIFFTCLMLNLLFNQSSLGQIEGYVTDRSGKPLESANVYINKTTLGNYTTKSGYYKLTNIPLGEHQLVVEMIGYKTKKVNIIFTSNKIKNRNVRLRVNVNSEKPVLVEALHPKKWENLFNTFRTGFLGYSTFANECVFINRDVLQFFERDDYLEVKASESLKMINKALGYELTFDISMCKIYKRNEKLVYGMTIKFKDISTEENKRLVKENRRKVYFNSRKHFFKSLYTNQVDTNYFEIGELKEKLTVESLVLRKKVFDYDTIPEDTLLSYSHIKGFKQVYFPSTVYVKHLNLESLDRYWFKEPFVKHEYSQIVFKNDDSFLINKDGNTIYLTENILFKNYFGFLKLSGLLPEDYTIVSRGIDISCEVDNHICLYRSFFSKNKSNRKLCTRYVW